MKDGILSAIGHTPLVSLRRIFKETSFRLYAKLEGCNPGGSVKDRAALSILRRAIEAGEINRDTVVIESSSGNMGIGLAQACAYFGLRFICVVDPKATSQNIDIMRAYGAEVDLVTIPDARSGEFLQARIQRVQTLARSISNSFWPNQYGNLYNPIAHHQTMREIATELEGKVDLLICATSTCGTLRGCAEYLKRNRLKSRIIAVDAIGSVIFGGQQGKRLIPGHGAAVRPPLCQSELADDIVYVSDLECIVGCRTLVQKEGILAGGSSGAAVMAVSKYMDRIPAGANCVMIFPDRGERYLNTIYSDAWVVEHFGSVPALLEDVTPTWLSKRLGAD